MSEVNGVSEPAEAPDGPESWEHLGLLAGVPPEGLERIALQMNHAFAETQRRDGNAVDHAKRMTRAFFGVLVALGIAVGVIVWMFAHSRDVEVVVQTVVYDKEGQFVSLGLPMDLLTYDPKDGEWINMLNRWVLSYRWRTDEQERLLTQENWKWLYAHTCGGAAEKLQEEEKEEKPLVRTDLVRSVKLQPITKTPTTFVAVWQETTVDKARGLKTPAWKVGTFTVGRTRPTTRAEADLNTLGLCVTSYNVREGTPIN
jgi:type IV secretory pathway TrbF-like protein